jgi:hypothetical protein
VNTVRTLVGCGGLTAARARVRPRSPAQLAQRLIKGWRPSPTLVLISDALHRAVTIPDQRICISAPPRTGKSALVSQIGPLYGFMRYPDMNVISASYADSLAWENSHAARVLVAENTDLLGFTLSSDKAAVGRWKLGPGPDGIRRQGGLLAAGILSGILGFGANLLLIDDPIQNQLHADSVSHRRRVVNEFRSTLMTRLMPNGSVVIISSRFHENDLIGTLLAEEPDRWEFISVPAISQAGVPDALDRAPGVAMVSALGRTSAQFDDIRRSVGERAWYSMFQGVPSSPTGGLVKSSWLDQWRLPCAPSHSVFSVVGVDPSDSGSGDSCGLVAASMTSDGVVAVIADQSAPMTSDAWARAAVALAIDVGASEISVEAFAAGATYVRVVNEALGRVRTPHPIRVTAWPPKGSGRGRGDSVARSAALLQALEVGTCRIAGHLPNLEAAATTFQAGQHIPDALAALVVAHDVLVHSAGRGCVIVAPDLNRRLGGGGGGPASRLRAGGGGGGMPGRSAVVSIDEALAYRRRLGTGSGGRYR